MPSGTLATTANDVNALVSARVAAVRPVFGKAMRSSTGARRSGRSGGPRLAGVRRTHPGRRCSPCRFVADSDGWCAGLLWPRASHPPGCSAAATRGSAGHGRLRGCTARGAMPGRTRRRRCSATWFPAAGRRNHRRACRPDPGRQWQRGWSCAALLPCWCCRCLAPRADEVAHRLYVGGVAGKSEAAQMPAVLDRGQHRVVVVGDRGGGWRVV